MDHPMTARHGPWSVAPTGGWAHLNRTLPPRAYAVGYSLPPLRGSRDLMGAVG